MARRFFLALTLAAAGGGLVLAANEITRFVFGCAGGEVQSGRHSITATIGEPVVAEATSATHTLRAGFWFCVAGSQSGDVNCDGLVNPFDIDPFILALTDPGAYHAHFPDCDISGADTNNDGQVNAFDIDPFIALLTGG
jgi:hypothetical protein